MVLETLLLGGGVLWLLYKFKWVPEREAESAARLRKELEDLRRTPTSSTGDIRGHRITRQIKMIAVDNHRKQDDAELDFFRQVQGCGGTGVINMKVRRQKGGFISIQGDAVVLG